MAIIRNQKINNNLNSTDIEIALARHLNYRQNLIVPNVFWGLGFRYELDLLVVYQSGWACEIEIKVSKADLKADLNKKHQHYSERIQRLYFAVPNYLKDEALKLIPERAGLFVVEQMDGFYRTHIEKSPKINKLARKFTNEEINKLYRLMAMRIWTLKEHIRNKRYAT